MRVSILEFVASVQANVRVADNGAIVDSRDEMCVHLAEIPAEQLLEMETHDLAAIISGAVGVLPLESAGEIVLGNSKLILVRTGHAAARIIEALLANPSGTKKVGEIRAFLRRGLDYDEIRPLLYAPKGMKNRRAMPATKQPKEDSNAE